ncbi:actinia tenebrosa protease inhibitors-like [Dermacentor silvarum]|uniref:actinia tenebrosa protease inhibitors-like n=1 Tax=Dermacentor silvarum TaxID=543639 RepID=UPI001898FAD5|nr:actinia tenebrosa protease inhibitors-like [Dermacentor silvarum]
MPISDGHACPHRRKGGYMAYGYSWKTQKCHRFWHKGCGGNNNQFTAAENCWKTCAGNSASKCSKPPEVHRYLTGFRKRYYYNVTSDSCMPAKYWSESTQGKNRFTELTDCERECRAWYSGPLSWME